jgi:hypothetical protein
MFRRSASGGVSRQHKRGSHPSRARARTRHKTRFHEFAHVVHGYCSERLLCETPSEAAYAAVVERVGDEETHRLSINPPFGGMRIVS